MRKRLEIQGLFRQKNLLLSRMSVMKERDYRRKGMCFSNRCKALKVPDFRKNITKRIGGITMNKEHISFSQLKTVEECPYEYYLMKMVGVDPAENAFAQAGTLAHQLLVRWAKGEIPIEELPDQWMKQFNETVTDEFPAYLKGYREKLFNSILLYFETFDGFSEYEIVGAEKEFNSSIAGERFVGIIDLILRNKEGGLVIVDHKSCSLSSFRKNKNQMYRQLLLYSKYCADEYGTFPEMLRFNLFKEGTYDERPFDQNEYVAARQWAETVIGEMKSKDMTDWFETRPEQFRCTNLCNCRMECPFGKAENHKRKENEYGKTAPVAA